MPHVLTRTRHRRARRPLARACAAVAALGALAAPAASANSVTDWNERARHALVDVAHQPPWDQSRNFAIVSTAVFDAVNAIDGTPRRPYVSAPPAERWFAKDAAVAAAAHRVLVTLLPAQQAELDQHYADALAAVPDGPAEDGGVTVGRSAADALLAARAGDGADGTQQWPAGTLPGEWRPTAPYFVGVGGQVGFTKPFVIPSADAFPRTAPNPIASAAYAKELEEVKALGSATSTKRTADQTEAARFWDDPNVPWWNALNRLAVQRGLSVPASARLFALVHLSVADGMIVAFKGKHVWHNWRPITAIQEAAGDGNVRTAGDASWTPLLATPPFPEHPSGHAVTSAALTTALGLFFGTDNVSLTAASQVTGTTRRYESLSQALAEVVNARVWGGIHFRTGGKGVVEGAQVARHVWGNALQPTG